MADLADISDEHAAPLLEANVAYIRYKAQSIEPGKPGECEKCGEDMPRLVRGICCRCRDLHKLP